jgi:hypothetical protein
VILGEPYDERGDEGLGDRGDSEAVVRTSCVGDQSRGAVVVDQSVVG